MRFKIVEEKDNPVLKRKEMIASIDYEQGSTPSKAEMQKIVAEQMKANIENVEISKILSENGMSIGMAWVKIWQEKKIPAYKTKKAETKPEESKKAEDKKEEKPAEAPKEVPQEEAKAEGEQ